MSLFDLSQQSGHIGVELSLEEVASHGSAEVVLGHVVTDLDVQATLASAEKREKERERERKSMNMISTRIRRGTYVLGMALAEVIFSDCLKTRKT